VDDATLDELEKHTDEVDIAMRRLLALLGGERVVQLTQKIEEVITDSHFGNVTIVITDGRVRLLKAEKSYE
jgi:hypothetical protein